METNDRRWVRLTLSNGAPIYIDRNRILWLKQSSNRSCFIQPNYGPGFFVEESFEFVLVKLGKTDGPN